ncbi:hypothetical protein USDA257_p02070 (plasmid) [Sinorhizobium fredii USDA 257]|uniref:Uncharacterized protein n=1 Tax=Sinorhizobium fredii (strain USDA 257) TaxID=1185652 RepID=I3XGB6_SINF2|nr:hypothetical protein USDA257_p02070 [Sinorhizobium fredii USDA 257]
MNQLPAPGDPSVSDPDRSQPAVGACEKIPIPAIELNPFTDFFDGHSRSTSARHMRIDSFLL